MLSGFEPLGASNECQKGPVIPSVCGGEVRRKSERCGSQPAPTVPSPLPLRRRGPAGLPSPLFQPIDLHRRHSVMTRLSGYPNEAVMPGPSQAEVSCLAWCTPQSKRATFARVATR